ncbi:enoyl-CoA hydratase/isomerase family protein [Nocardia sp. alder85J]|uniref:enoyl-CoA hydratase/isomerase family protein n=1 Tax=Nocardia sp. alder85J TaxID=2862949 RepID=UPI001CD2EFD1|nr:enoyl-CoA hydratase/isomerase family protein [Nocardia sp. alder85J]MCX4095673.1 enoyl-CoA hydratase/isomerase family protein [Nocardia sp. alder85J]
MPAQYDAIAVSREGSVGLIELDDEERLNPTDTHTVLAEINDVLIEFGRDRSTRAVVIFGRGRAFSAGANLGAKRPARYPQDDDDSAPSRLAYGYAYGQVWDTLHNFKKPLVAAVNGWCLGGGWELAHACDLIVAGESAKFGAVETDIGLIPFATSTVYLPRMVGKHRAMDMILNARRIDASRALELGLVNEVVPVERTFDRAREVAAELAARPPIAVSFARELIKRAMAVTEFYDLERAYGYYLQTTEDARTARAAVFERTADSTPPVFIGR